MVDNGFQANGYVSTVPNEDFEFDDESVESFEIGGKHEFAMAHALELGGVLFGIRTTCKQRFSKGSDLPLSNAASSEVAGSRG